MNTWEAVFTQSRVNDGHYDEADLPQQAWQWPTETWFRERLEYVRGQDATAFLRSLNRIKTEATPEPLPH